MALIPIEHPHRLGSPAAAEAFFRGIRAKVVSARGFHTSDPAQIAALVAAIEHRREHTISFEGGTLDAAAREALDALAAAPYGYLDLRTTAASLRIWPGRHAWVDAGDAHVETEELADALRRFHAADDPHMQRGHITATRPAAAPALRAFLAACAPRVNAVLELDVAAARRLTEQFPRTKLDWQSYPVLVDFPDGRIHGFLTTPKTGPKHRKKWLARVDKALTRADLVESGDRFE